MAVCLYRYNYDLTLETRKDAGIITFLTAPDMAGGGEGGKLREELWGEQRELGSSCGLHSTASRTPDLISLIGHFARGGRNLQLSVSTR